MSNVAEAMRRAAAVYERRPSAGLHDDAPGVVSWVGGLRMEARHSLGHAIATDMPAELGGSGDQVSPGWLVRSGVAACTATTIAAIAAERGIALEALEVRVDSRSDTRGYLGLSEADGAAVPAGPDDLRMRITIRAPAASEAEVRAIVEASRARAPMTALVTNAGVMPLDLSIEAG